MLYGFGGYTADTSEKLSWAPQVSFAKISSQPGVFSENFISTKALKQAKGFAYAHDWWKLHKNMNMVRHDL